jgi:hypothetical protein
MMSVQHVSGLTSNRLLVNLVTENGIVAFVADISINRYSNKQLREPNTHRLCITKYL